MPYILIEDFKGGIDTRRTVITSVPGTAVNLKNCHVTRGGEIEKRRAFTKLVDLPEGKTFGLTAVGGRVYVFGSEPPTTSGTTSLPAASTPAQPLWLQYLQMEHATGSSIKMRQVLSVDWFNAKPFVAAEFDDGMFYHYWGGEHDPGYSGSGSPVNRITDFYDGRGKRSIKVNAGSATGTFAKVDVTITGGTQFSTNRIDSITINGVELLDSPVAHTGDNGTTKVALQAAINANTSSPNYTATDPGGLGSGSPSFQINANVNGESQNGFPVVATTSGDFTLTISSTLSGAENDKLTDLTVNGVKIIENPVYWETSHSYTASKIADEINRVSTSPEWEAISDDDSPEVIIRAEEHGSWSNGYAVVATVNSAGALSILDSQTSSASIQAIAGGSIITSGQAQQGGPFVKSFGAKMHTLVESNWHYSKVDDPTVWDSQAGVTGGSGFDNLANHARGSEELMAIESYFDNLAIFGQDCIQIWKSDPNPDLIQQVQVLNNTGTIAAKSVAAIGDQDVFYLSRSGIRSLRSRDSSNSAHVGDIGNPIDDLLIADINSSSKNAESACSILDPRNGRYMLAIGSKVYVFSYFPSSQVSAWSVYEPGFVISDWAFDGKQIICRSGDSLYSLGGIADDEYDDCSVEVSLPFLDAGKPGHQKMWTGIDSVCEGDWVVSIATDALDITATSVAATINKATYGLGRVALSSASSHLALKLTNNTTGAAKLGNVAVHYEINESG